MHHQVSMAITSFIQNDVFVNVLHMETLFQTLDGVANATIKREKSPPNQIRDEY